MRKLIFCGIVAAAFAGVAFGFTPTRHTNVLTRAGVTYVQRGALGAADYVATNVTMSAADVNALPNNEAQLLAMPAFTNAVRAIGGCDRITNLTSVVTADGEIITRASTNATTWATNTLLSTASHAVMYSKEWWTDDYTILDVAKHTGRNPETSEGKYAFAAGLDSIADGDYATALGRKAYANDENSFVWNGFLTGNGYGSYDVGTFSINPIGGLEGFYIGENTMSDILSGYVTTGRKVAGKPLSSDVTLGTLTIGSQTYNGSGNVTVDMSGYVPTSRTVNGKPLTGNVTITKNDIDVDETKVWNTNGTQFISGDLGVYNQVVADFVYTNGVSMAESVVPSGMRFEHTLSNVWTAVKDGNTYTVTKLPWDSTIAKEYVFLKNGERAFPANDIVKYDGSDTPLEFGLGMFTMYKVVTQMASVRTDKLITETEAESSFMPLHGAWQEGTPNTNRIDLLLKLGKRSGLSIGGTGIDTWLAQGFEKRGMTTLPILGLAASNTFYHSTYFYPFARKTEVDDVEGYVVERLLPNGQVKAFTDDGDETIESIRLVPLDGMPIIVHDRYEGDTHVYDDNYILPVGKSGTIALENASSLAVMLNDATTNTTADATISTNLCKLVASEVTNTVNKVKAQFYDQPLQVNWTMQMVNGEMKLYATTNVNMSVAN